MFTRGFGLFAVAGFIASVVGHLLSLLGVDGVDVFRWASTAIGFAALGVLGLGVLYQRWRWAHLRRDPARVARPLTQPPAGVAEELDGEFIGLVTSGRVAGAVVAVDLGGEPAYRAYAPPGASPAFDQRTVFEIGSVTKTFTALLLADAVLRGEIALEDPVEEHLPGVALQRGGQRSTILDLATHRAGLSRVPPRMAGAVFSRAPDPYSRWDEPRLERWAHHARPRSRPGTRFRYSNFGFALLGLALSRAAGRPYDDLLRERVLEPLGMSDTHVGQAPAHQDRLAPGHDYFGARAASWHMAAISPAGGLRSTAADMHRYLAAQMRPDETPLADAIRLAHDPRREIRSSLVGRLLRPRGSGQSRIGLAWITTQRPAGAVTWHNGGTGGFRSWVGVDRAAGTGAAVLSASPRSVDAAGFALLGRTVG